MASRMRQLLIKKCLLRVTQATTNGSLEKAVCATPEVKGMHFIRRTLSRQLIYLRGKTRSLCV